MPVLVGAVLVNGSAAVEKGGSRLFGMHANLNVAHGVLGSGFGRSVVRRAATFLRLSLTGNLNLVLTYA